MHWSYGAVVVKWHIYIHRSLLLQQQSKCSFKEKDHAESNPHTEHVCTEQLHKTAGF